jgi:hypothetical protein
MNADTGIDDVYPTGDEALVGVAAGSLCTTIETLQRFEEFFGHHASPAVHAELRAFCAAQGWHGVCAAQALLDNLGLLAFTLRHAMDAATNRAAVAPRDRR